MQARESLRAALGEGAAAALDEELSKVLSTMPRAVPAPFLSSCVLFLRDARFAYRSFLGSLQVDPVVMQTLPAPPGQV